MTELEKDIERKLRRMVERRGGLCLKWVCPGWSGVPDRILLLPGGRMIFCELKRPKGGKISKLQEWWRDRLTALGFTVLFVFDAEQIKYIEFLIEEEIQK